MALTPEQKAALEVYIAQEAAGYAQIQTNLLAGVKRLLEGAKDTWFDRDAMRRLAGDLSDLVRPAQETIADLTSTYLEHVYDTMEISAPPNMAVRLPVSLRFDATPLQEWERPGRDARVGRLLGLDEFEANEKALQRAEEQARMDAALARREAERQLYGVTDDVIGFRRILHPELTMSGPCGLCIVAATRIYGKKDLKPLHNGCACSSLPVTKSNDPGNSINLEDLDKFYDAAGGTGREGLQRVRVQVSEHGELGPILVDARHRNTGAEKAKERGERGLDPKRVIDAQERIIRKLEADLAAGRVVNERTLNQHRQWLAEWQDRAA